MDIQLGNPKLVYLIVFSVLAVVLTIGSILARSRAAARFASADMLSNIFPGQSIVRKVLSSLLVATCIAFLAIGLLDIRWGKTTREVPQKGIEVMFALDVSRSMLAEDASPNRLRRAKQQIKDMIDEMAGDRVGLIVFAGEADQAVPLTSHYDDFKQILDTVGPHSVSVGGSRLGVAIQAAADGFIDKTNDHKTIILFTDGEDQESHPVELAQKLHADDGVRIFTVGLGDFDQGSRIPDSDSKQKRFVEHDGQQVWSKLNGQILRSIATETGGAYIPAGIKRVNMADVYHGYVANIQQSEFETAKINAYTPRFQWFAAAGLLLLLIEVWISTSADGANKLSRKSNKSRLSNSENLNGNTEMDYSDDHAPGFKRTEKASVGAAAILLCLALPTSLHAQSSSVPEQINAANQLLRDQEVSKAIDAFNRIDDTGGKHRDQLNYNLAVAHYRNDDFAAAKTLFTQASQSSQNDIAANSRYNLGNCHYSLALPMVEQDAMEAIDELRTAIELYLGSLRINRDNADARANIELAQHLIQKLEDQEKQDQSQENDQQSNDKQQSDQQQENQDQSENDSEENNSDDQNSENQQSDESKPNEDQQSENRSQSDPNQQPSDGDSQRQNDPSQSENNSDINQPSGSQETEQEKNGSENQSAQNERGDNNQDDPSAKSEEQSNSQSDDKDSTSAGNEALNSKQPPTGDLTASNSDDATKKETGSNSRTAADDELGVLTKEEALKLLQSVRDRDMIRRLRQQQRQRSRRVRVEKDW